MVFAHRRVLYCISVCLVVQTHGKSKNLDASRASGAGIKAL